MRSWTWFLLQPWFWKRSMEIADAKLDITEFNDCDSNTELMKSFGVPWNPKDVNPQVTQPMNFTTSISSPLFYVNTTWRCRLVLVFSAAKVAEKGLGRSKKKVPPKRLAWKGMDDVSIMIISIILLSLLEHIFLLGQDRYVVAGEASLDWILMHLRSLGRDFTYLGVIEIRLKKTCLASSTFRDSLERKWLMLSLGGQVSNLSPNHRTIEVVILVYWPPDKRCSFASWI